MNEEDTIKNGRYQRNIRSEDFFDNSFLGNSVRVNSVALERQKSTIYIHGLDFTPKKTVEGSDTQIAFNSDEPIIKFHFTLEGSYAYKPLSHLDYKVQIPENHCNMFYCPRELDLDFFGLEDVRALEIFVKPVFLRNLLGDEYKSVIQDLNIAIKNHTAFIFWEKSKFIPPHIRSILNEIMHCPYKGKLEKTYIEAKLSVLIVDFLVGRSSKILVRAKTKLHNADYLAIVKVEAHIRNNLKEPLKISDLALIAGFNATKLKRDFKDVYGMPIFKYITAQRMEVAKRLIIEDEMNIATVAYEVGYSNPQHFTTAFKRTMGYVPSVLKP